MRMPGLSYSMRLHALASSDASTTPVWGLDAQDLLSILSLQVSDSVEGDGRADALPHQVLLVPGEVVAKVQATLMYRVN